MKKDVVGIWVDGFQEGILWRIRIGDDRNCLLELGETGSNKWATLWNLTTSIQDGTTLYNIAGEKCEKYYKVEDTGDLSVFDDRGYIATFKVVK